MMFRACTYVLIYFQIEYADFALDYLYKIASK